MFKTLNNKINIKNAFVQSNFSNLIKQEFKTLKMLSKKISQTIYFTSLNLQNFS